MKNILLTLSTLLLLWSCTEEKAPETSEGPAPSWATYQSVPKKTEAKKVVLVSGDEEYRSEEALPQLAKILAQRHGFDCTVLFAQDPEQPGIINPNYVYNIPGLEQLAEADLLVLFTRFRELPDQQMAYFEAYFKAGKPVIGLRTATHAFRFRDTLSPWRHWGNYYAGEKTDWQGGFGQLVLGTNWHSHHGHHKHQSTRGIIPREASKHPILNGIPSGEIWGPTDVYGLPGPLDSTATPLVFGQVTDNTGSFDEEDVMYGMREDQWAIASTNPASEDFYNPNQPMMPVAWLKPYQLPGGQPGQAFASTMGASTDMLDEEFRRLLVNAAFHLTGQTVPEKATVDTVGSYQPTAFRFHDDAYWQERQLRVPASMP
jgi:hypothetical protein